ncbi:hypothetical protein AGABI2DRAFT_186311 [Agaricus bisporus var. bisporus H97]|uniref:hypothetical protein n=1 Tax=Agaricus bisporus var. bisporus (strain H97 / ATCC MYA-4626 / FGSC 10389) TaxID=936046 RepID=UPI00029F5778|nr:hypothetical protein AGABI2DRAFT_186311 [Agaricus bisporus var. bisporus H97]EKV45570.1 hypothetical protein AGABI2DRAFT_186311 [Agaricus bisporus var. bisporus H97]
MFSRACKPLKKALLTRTQGLKSVTDGGNELFEFTSGRWLYNERSQREARRTPFNVEAFCRTACAATGATAVTQISKISESINRVLLVKFENGSEAIARFPTRLGGTPHHSTASEVATMEFLRRRIGIPVPRVIAWNSRASTHEVQAEFILMEKVSGRPLRDVVDGSPLSPPEKLSFALELIKLQKQLLAVKFAAYGALYFTQDIPEHQRLSQFLAHDVSPHSVDSEFCLGPMPRRDFWRGERTSMKIDRGPWTTPQQYLLALADREHQWIQEFHTPHFIDHPLSYLPQQSNVSEFLRDLKNYKQMIPFLVPKKESLVASVLWHPDLHGDNILVEETERDDEGNRQFKIVSILDWESAWAGPMFLQLDVPDFLRWGPQALTPMHDVALPSDLKEKSELEQKEIKAVYKRILVHRAYQLRAWPVDLINFHGRNELVALEGIMREPWLYGLSPVRQNLLHVVRRWDSYCPKVDLPIDIDDEYVLQHERAYDSYESLDKLHSEICDELGIGELGYVRGNDSARFQAVTEILAIGRKEFIDGGKNEDERRQRALVWPFQDTVDIGHNPRGVVTDMMDF